MEKRELGNYAYINDFLFVVIRPNSDKKGSFLYCSGVNTTKFYPITRDRHGIASNPAFRGLQLLKQDIRAKAIAVQAHTASVKGVLCAGLGTAEGAWYTEGLIIDNAPDSFPSDIMEFAVLNIINRILTLCLPACSLLDKLPEPAELQKFLESQAQGK